jgi:hypothetical protein
MRKLVAREAIMLEPGVKNNRGPDPWYLRKEVNREHG